MLTGIGVDIIEIKRVTKACANPRFLERIFTVSEQQYCLQRKNPYPCLAARFAAKEAVLKALSTGLAGCRFLDIEILPESPGGQPVVQLSGGAQKVATQQAVERVLISISHDHTKAVAFAIAEKG